MVSADALAAQFINNVNGAADVRRRVADRGRAAPPPEPRPWASRRAQAGAGRCFCCCCAPIAPKKRPVSIPIPTLTLTLDRARAQPTRRLQGFSFCSHTFSHMNLDNVTKADTQFQMTLNTAMAGSVRRRGPAARACVRAPREGTAAVRSTAQRTGHRAAPWKQMNASLVRRLTRAPPRIAACAFAGVPQPCGQAPVQLQVHGDPRGEASPVRVGQTLVSVPVRSLAADQARVSLKLPWAFSRALHPSSARAARPQPASPPPSTQISGLLNGDALSTLAAQGIKCATGDNTWPALFNNPDNVHHMVYTTAAKNGYAGMAILPRFATEVGRPRGMRSMSGLWLPPSPLRFAEGWRGCNLAGVQTGGGRPISTPLADRAAYFTCPSASPRPT
jgi:hypothetical protein